VNRRSNGGNGIVVHDLTCATEEVLVNQAKQGDELALTELLKRKTPQIWKCIWRITKNQQDTEDAFQDACFKCFLHVNDFDGRSKFSTWFTRIAINSALMNLRKRRVHREAAIEFGDFDSGDRSWDIADNSIDTTRCYEGDESSRILRSAIRRLRPSLRRIVEIQLRLDASPAEVAQAAGLSLPATKSRLIRAKTVLRRYLNHVHCGAGHQAPGGHGTASAPGRYCKRTGREWSRTPPSLAQS